QPWLTKTALPAAGSPVTAVGLGSVPSTVLGSGATVFPPPQAVRTKTQPAARSRAGRRIAGASLVEAAHGAVATICRDEAQGLRPGCGPLPADVVHGRTARCAVRCVRRRSLLRAEHRPRADARDRDRARALPVLHLGQA